MRNLSLDEVVSAIRPNMIEDSRERFEPLGSFLRILIMKVRNELYPDTQLSGYKALR